MQPKTPEELKKSLEDFVDFIRQLNGDEFIEEEPIEDKVSQLKPAVVDILIKSEKKFFAAIDALYKKHSTLTTIEDIDKLTKDILKVCK